MERDICRHQYIGSDNDINRCSYSFNIQEASQYWQRVGHSKLAKLLRAITASNKKFINNIFIFVFVSCHVCAMNRCRVISICRLLLAYCCKLLCGSLKALPSLHMQQGTKLVL